MQGGQEGLGGGVGQEGASVSGSLDTVRWVSAMTTVEGGHGYESISRSSKPVCLRRKGEKPNLSPSPDTAPGNPPASTPEEPGRTRGGGRDSADSLGT